MVYWENTMAGSFKIAFAIAIQFACAKMNNIGGNLDTGIIDKCVNSTWIYNNFFPDWYLFLYQPKILPIFKHFRFSAMWTWQENWRWQWGYTEVQYEVIYRYNGDMARMSEYLLWRHLLRFFCVEVPRLLVRTLLNVSGPRHSSYRWGRDSFRSPGLRRRYFYGVNLKFSCCTLVF